MRSDNFAMPAPGPRIIPTISPIASLRVGMVKARANGTGNPSASAVLTFTLSLSFTSLSRTVSISRLRSLMLSPPQASNVGLAQVSPGDTPRSVNTRRMRLFLTISSEMFFFRSPSRTLLSVMASTPLADKKDHVLDVL